MDPELSRLVPGPRPEGVEGNSRLPPAVVTPGAQTTPPPTHVPRVTSRPTTGLVPHELGRVSPATPSAPLPPSTRPRGVLGVSQSSLSGPTVTESWTVHPYLGPTGPLLPLEDRDVIIVSSREVHLVNQTPGLRDRDLSRNVPDKGVSSWGRRVPGKTQGERSHPFQVPCRGGGSGSGTSTVPPSTRISPLPVVP